MTLAPEFPHLLTEHPCGTCQAPLHRVSPSTMLVCDEPSCDADPTFLLPPTPTRAEDAAGLAARSGDHPRDGRRAPLLRGPSPRRDVTS